MIGRRAGRGSECSGSARRGPSGPSERQSEQRGASGGDDSSWEGGSLKRPEGKAERKHHRRRRRGEREREKRDRRKEDEKNLQKKKCSLELLGYGVARLLVGLLQVYVCVNVITTLCLLSKTIVVVSCDVSMIVETESALVTCDQYRLLPGWVEVEGAGLATQSHRSVTEGNRRHQREEGEAEEREKESWPPRPLQGGGDVMSL